MENAGALSGKRCCTSIPREEAIWTIGRVWNELSTVKRLPGIESDAQSSRLSEDGTLNSSSVAYPLL